VTAKDAPMNADELHTLLSTAITRLQRLEDEHAILATLYRYSHGINAKNRQLWLDVFMQDG